MRCPLRLDHSRFRPDGVGSQWADEGEVTHPFGRLILNLPRGTARRGARQPAHRLLAPVRARASGWAPAINGESSERVHGFALARPQPRRARWTTELALAGGRPYAGRDRGRDRQASTDQPDSPERTEPALANEHTERTEANEPADPIDSTDPADPIDRIDPVDPMDKIDPLEPMLRTEPDEPVSDRARTPLPMGPFSQQAGRRRMVVLADQRARGVAAMEDILSQGGDRDPGPRPRRLALIAALVAAVIGGGVYLGVSHQEHAPAAARPAPVPASQAPGPAGSAALGQPSGIAGRTLAWDPSLRLLVAGGQPAWLAPASGRAEPIDGLPADQSGYEFTRVAGGWAVQASSPPPAGCGNCAGPPTPVWFLPDGARAATRVGTANLVAPAATAGTLWLTSYAPGVNMTTAAGTAREAGAVGGLTLPVTLPPGYAIDQGTDRGLLLAPVSQQPGAADKLWDPAAPRASRAFDGVLAAGPREIAWTTPCAPRCTVQTLNLATGKHAAVTLPAGSSAAGGAFSPDGSYLALQMSLSSAGDDGELAMQLGVASTSTGTLTPVPGTFASSDALVGFGWPVGGDSLVAEFSFTTKTQLASWNPGASIPAVTMLRPDQAALILG